MQFTVSALGNVSAIYLSALMGASWLAQQFETDDTQASMGRATHMIHLIGGGASALALALPIIGIGRVIAGCFVAMVALIGGLKDLRQKEPCHCLGNLISQNPIAINVLRVGAIAAAVILIYSYLVDGVVAWSVITLGLSVAIWTMIFLRIKYLQYARQFYSQRYHRVKAPKNVELSWAVGTDENTPIEFSELLSEKLTLLVGISSTCVSCQKVADELGQLLKKSSNALQVVVVSNSERMRSHLPTTGFRYLIDPEIEVAKHLGVGGTPFLAMIDFEGTIKFAPVDGKEPVIAKLKEVFSGFSSP